jgi:pimeloyl-ACP methyl ester carboxylesterase
MRPLARELARDHQVAYWDYRGHGGSAPAPPGAGYRIVDHAMDLERVVETCSPVARPLMVSFSMGVQVHAEWIRRNPGRASAHVFFLGMPRNPLPGMAPVHRAAATLLELGAAHNSLALRAIQPALKLGLRTTLTHKVARGLRLIQPDCPRDDFMEFVRYATSVPLDAYLRCLAGLLEHDATEVLAQVREPMLLVAAGRDVLVSGRGIRALAAMLPRADFALLPAGSHAAALEHGPLLARRVRQFLASVPPAGQAAA